MRRSASQGGQSSESRLAANGVAALDRECDAPEQPTAETARWLSGMQKYAPVLSRLTISK